MKAVIQRVTKGEVKREGKVISSINTGYVVLLGIYEGDTEKDIDVFVKKLVNLRIMSDDEKKMNRSIKDVSGEVLLVSQFTLCADLTFGRRPSFIKAMKPDKAVKLYEYCVSCIKDEGLRVQTGAFGEYMEVTIVNDGPVTILYESS